MITSKSKILLVEDDQFICRAYSDGLSRAGFEMILAADGQEGLEKAKENKPDIILLDLIMPIMNGFEFLEKIKQDNNLKNIPAIILSNLGQESDVAKGKELGAKDYLIKSDYSMEEVVNKVKEHLKKE